MLTERKVPRKRLQTDLLKQQVKGTRGTTPPPLVCSAWCSGMCTENQFTAHGGCGVHVQALMQWCNIATCYLLAAALAPPSASMAWAG